VAFEVDTGALRERVRQATGNPFIRGIHFRQVEVYPQDETWWAGRDHRFARVYLSEMDRESLDYVQKMHPVAYRRLNRLLSELLSVPRLEILPLVEEHTLGEWLRGSVGRFLAAVRGMFAQSVTSTGHPRPAE
jgi:hypothetical protein